MRVLAAVAVGCALAAVVRARDPLLPFRRQGQARSAGPMRDRRTRRRRTRSDRRRAAIADANN